MVFRFFFARPYQRAYLILLPYRRIRRRMNQRMNWRKKSN